MAHHDHYTFVSVSTGRSGSVLRGVMTEAAVCVDWPTEFVFDVDDFDFLGTENK
jgi:hypothetical protein